MKETISNTGDGVAVGVAVMTVIEFLPAIAAGLTVIWMVLRIWHMWLKIQRHRRLDKQDEEEGLT